MRSPVRMSFFAMLFLLAAVPIGSARSAVVINEIMAANSKTLADPQKQYDDWIELYNPGDTSFDLAGCYLTDDPANPTKWQFPKTTLVPAKEYLVLWVDGDVQDSGLHAGFSLNSDGEELRLFASDGTTLLDSVALGPQTCDVSYGRYPDGTATWRYSGVPSPGTTNLRASDGITAPVGISRSGGFYDAPLNVTLTCPTPEATIYYTLDGREPLLASGTIYTTPIRITRTTCLRALATKPGWLSGPVNTRTYIFLSDVVAQSSAPAGFPATWGSATADYQMAPYITNDPAYSPLMKDALLSLPSLSIVMNTDDMFGSNGIYSNPQNEDPNDTANPQWERPASAELIYPDGRTGFQINCGIQIQGAWFRTPSVHKHSFRLLFKSVYGPSTLKYPWFGDDAVDEFDTVVLRAGANDGYTWSGDEVNAQFIRDEFARDLQHDMGHAAVHGTFVHLYINGLYWGLYNPCEHPDATFSAAYSGGQEHDWDVFKHKGFELVQGNRTALNQMLSACQQASTSFEAYQRLQGMNPDGTCNASYPHLLDVPNYADYMIINMWAGNWDWPWNNYWIARDRTPAGTGFKFYCWDTEDIILTSRSAINKEKVTQDRVTEEVGQPYGSLRTNPEFKLQFADRVHRHFFNDGLLTPNSLVKRYTDLARRVELAVVTECARWGDQYGRSITPQQWITKRDTILKTYLPQRPSIVLGQFRSAGLYPTVDAPAFNIDGIYQHGGHVVAGAALSMEAAAGTVWYTLDGSDPRMPTAAGASNGLTLVAENATKKVFVPTAAIDDAWRGSAAFDDAAWTATSGDPGGVGYDTNPSSVEDYTPLISLNVQTQMYNKNTTCYIRIPFTVATADAGKLTSLTLNVRCDDGFIAYLNGVTAYSYNCPTTLLWNSAATAVTEESYAVELQACAVTSAAAGAIVAGENLLTIQALNDKKGSSDFLISVTLTAVKGGVTATPAGVAATALPYAAPIALSASTAVKARVLSGTTWSALNEAVYAVGPVAENLRISEIMYHPLDPNCEYIELTNIGSAALHLNRVTFTQGIDFTFGDVELAPHAYVVLVEDPVAFAQRYGASVPVAGRYAGNLSNGGERLRIQDAVGGVIEDFRYRDDWYDLTDGLGYSLTIQTAALPDPNVLNDADAWRLSTQGGGSPGYDDGPVEP